MQVIEKVAMFHDPESDGAFKVMETGTHTISETDIKQVAKKDEVVAEKENAIQEREKNENIQEVQAEIESKS